MVAPANSRGHLFWYWRRFGAVWAGAGFVRSGLASRAGLVQLRAPAWAKPLGRAWAGAILGVAGRGDSVKVASHVVNHFATAAFSDKTYRFI